MALITSGLTNGGVTTHYRFQYDDSLQKTSTNPGGLEPDRTNQVIAACENDFTLMSGWFGNISLDVNFTIPVNVLNQGGGAGWSTSGSNLTVTIKPAGGSSTLIRYLLVAEMVEQFERAQGLGWFGNNTEGSEGEGLSRFLAFQFLSVNGLGTTPPAGFTNSNAWLSSERADFVNNIAGGDDGPDKVTGCSLLFIFYLFSQLGFSVNQIVAAGANTLGGVYRNLTGDTADPFPFFKQLVDTAFPGTATITSGNLDNPFPLGILSFTVDKNTYGRDEVTDAISSASHGSFSNAFWLVLEALNIQTFNALGRPAPSLSGAFKNLPQLNIDLNASGVEFEDPNQARIPQRIRFPYDITFHTATLASFPAPGAASLLDVLNGQIASLPGASAITEFELVGGADPYFTNVDPNQNNAFYLSQELRVFTATPGLNNTPVMGAPAFSNDSLPGAYNYIQSVLAWLNDPHNNFTNGINDPFTNGTLPQQNNALSGDSSVTPFTVSFFPLHVYSNYNFAIARVRLRGAPGPADAAQNTKVFFRLWSTQTADTDFAPGSTYRSNTLGGRPESPLPAPDAHTIPFFATSNNPDFTNNLNPEYGTNGVNNRTIEIPSGGNEAFAYYGCFLNVYDPNNKINGQAVQALLVGTHHCLVAEIAYDDAPILNGNGVTESPENSDKLAQRNLQLTHSDNPGPADTHRVPQTFDVRPSAAINATAGQLLDYPDELMIDWGRTPPGSIAHIYWPQVDALQVLKLASRMYGAHLLTASDSHTIDLSVTRGVSYVPIPPGSGDNFAGLLTVDLPTTVTRGQEYDILVRRVATRRAKDTGPVLTVAPRAAGKGKKGEEAEAELASAAAVKERLPFMRNWRYVVGTFQVKIPVTTSDVMLFPEENTLAIMKWRLEQMQPSNRWYPVMQRYISYISARVDGLGGDSNSIQPSPNGVPVEDKQDGGKEHSYSGKVCEVLYDCYGDFEGFVLDDCGSSHAFKTRERGFAEILLRALKERLLVTVLVEGRERRIQRLIVRC